MLNVVHNKASGQFELSQEKFNLEAGYKEKDEYLWWIPVTYASTSGDMTDTLGMFSSHS